MNTTGINLSAGLMQQAVFSGLGFLPASIVETPVAFAYQLTAVNGALVPIESSPSRYILFAKEGQGAMGGEEISKITWANFVTRGWLSSTVGNSLRTVEVSFGDSEADRTISLDRLRPLINSCQYRGAIVDVLLHMGMENVFVGYHVSSFKVRSVRDSWKERSIDEIVFEREKGKLISIKAVGSGGAGTNVVISSTGTPEMNEYFGSRIMRGGTYSGGIAAALKCSFLNYVLRCGGSITEVVLGGRINGSYRLESLKAANWDETALSASQDAAGLSAEVQIKVDGSFVKELRDFGVIGQIVPRCYAEMFLQATDVEMKITPPNRHDNHQDITEMDVRRGEEVLLRFKSVRANSFTCLVTEVNSGVEYKVSYSDGMHSVLRIKKAK